jgi:NitT/TauT family transport system ATP-binding protein
MKGSGEVDMGVDSTRVKSDKVVFEVKDLGIGFGEREDILQGVDMRVHAGEFVTLLGPSGCGKTTILNLAAGLLRPRRGHVRFDGKPIEGFNTAAGYMTQDDTLLPWRSVSANIGLPLRMRKVSKPDVKARVDGYLRIMDLEHASSLYPGQLSGGMRRRALLARSMIYEPKLLLMDEPFAALDAQMRQQMHAELRETVTRLDQAVLFVTHDIAEAAALSDRVLVVGGGPPGGIIADIEIPFSKDRNLSTLRFEDDFFAVERELHEILNAAKLRASTKGEGEL